MKRKKILLIIVALIILSSAILFRIQSKNQLLAENFQVQVLENLYRPLDLIYLPLAFTPNKLPQYEITATNNDLNKLFDSLPKTKNEDEINQKRIVENRDYIPAKININDQQYEAKLTVRGINYRNYLGEKKSLKVKINQDQGAPFKIINLIVPEERTFIDDQVAYLMSRRLGFFGLKPGFAWIVINGKNMGVFQTLEDPEDESTIASAGLSGEDIFYSPEFKPQVTSGGVWSNIFDQGSTWKIDNKTTDPKPLWALEKFKSTNQLQGDEFYSQIADIVDIDQYLKFTAGNYLMGDIHQDNTHNQSLLFLKGKGLIWFVPNNNSIGDVDKLQAFHFNDFTEKMLGNPQFYWRRNEILWQLVTDEEFKKKLSNEIDDTYNLIKAPIFQDNLKPFRFIAFVKQFNGKKDTLLANFEEIKSYFTPYYIETLTKIDPWLKDLALLEVRSSSFFRPHLKSIEINLNTSGFGQIKAYFDANGNEKIDPGEEEIGTLQTSGGKGEMTINKDLSAFRFLQNPIDNIRPMAQANIILKGDNSFSGALKIDTKFINSLTGEGLKTINLDN